MDIRRTRFKRDIVTEFVPPSNRKSSKVMIFCSGVPGVPHKDDVLEFWAQKGFWTLFPRYRGSWESAGQFLASSPEKDILDVIDNLKKPFIDYWSGERYRVNAKSITVVGTSFGGPAAILASRDERVEKAICISPVVDWQAEDRSDPLDNLYKILTYGYSGAYRVTKKNWNKLAAGRFYNPARHTKEIDGRKVMIFHAKDDDIVRIESVLKFALRTACHFVVLNKGGHLSSTITMSPRHYPKVSRFIKFKDTYRLYRAGSSSTALVNRT